MVKKQIAYRYWDGNSFQSVEPEKKPVSKLGETGILQKMYGDIKYPPEARENGIQGDVLIMITINEQGKVENSVVKEDIGGGCGAEALRAIQSALQFGYEPMEVNGKPTRCQIDLPVRFRIE